MDNAPAPRGWRNPTIIAAIIAAIAAITVAIIGLVPKSPSPDSKPQPQTIIQRTSGPESPAVGQAGGNVTSTNEQQSTPKK